MMSRAFVMDGVGVEIVADRAEFLDAVDQRFASMRGSAVKASVRIELGDGIDEPSDDAWNADDARSVYDPPVGDVRYGPAQDLLMIRLGDGLSAWCAPTTGRAWIGAKSLEPDVLWYASHPVLNMCLAELLRARGRFPLHAAAVAHDGRALLVAGRSGSGKSTLTLALVRAGLALLGDDTCFLSHGADGLRIGAFPDEIDVTDDTIRMFGGLPSLENRTPRGIGRKRQLHPHELRGVTVVHDARPAALVFPQIAHADGSRLERMETSEALVELAPNVLLTNAVTAQRHIAVLAELAAAVPCYRLHTGRDLREAAGMLRALVAEPR